VTQVTVEAKYIADTSQYVAALRAAAKATTDLANQIPATITGQNAMGKSSRQMGASAQEAGKGFTVLKNIMGTALGIQAVGAFNKLTSGIKGFTKESFNAAARSQELDIAMVAIGTSTGIGKTALMDATKEIRAMGIELGASQQIAIEFAQNQLDLASASKVARVAQDLAVIAGQNSTQTTMILTQAIITGNSMLLKSAGISRLASEGYAEYAKEIGKSEGQLSSMERQQAVTNLILKEGKKVAGTYEGAMSSAGKVMRSFARIINDIQIEVGKVLLSALGPLILSTYDLLKAFSKTTQKGGALSGTLGTLATTFENLSTPLVEFIRGLIESVQSGEAMKSLSDTINGMIPVFLDLFEIVKSLGMVMYSMLVPALQALAPLFAAIAGAVRPIVEFFTKLPTPVKTAIGALILFRFVLTKMTAAAAANATGLAASFFRMSASIKLSLATIRANIVTTGFSFKTFGILAKTMGVSVAASFRAIGGAAKGLMASIGPVGLAIVAATVAFEYFSGKSAKQEELIGSLKTSVDELTGAYNELGYATASAKFRLDFSNEDVAQLEAMGISIASMSEAALAGGDAAKAYGNKLKDLSLAAGGIFTPSGELVTEVIGSFNELVAASAATHDSLKKDALAVADAQIIANKKAYASYELTRAKEISAATALRRESAKMIVSSDVASRKVAEGARIMAAAHDTAKIAILAVDTALRKIGKTISREASYDNAREGIIKLSEELKKGKKDITGYSQGALDNRKAIRDAAQGYIDYANSLKDPVKRQDALAEGTKKITKALQDQNINVKDSKILKKLKDESKQSGLTVDEFAKQRDMATEYGHDVGKNFIAGIIKELAAEKKAVETAAANLVGENGMVGAVNNELGIESPSKKAREVAKNFVAGLIIGVEENRKLAKQKVSELGQDVLDSLNERMQGVTDIFKTSGDAFRSFRDLTSGTEVKFGEMSKLQESFGRNASIGQIISQYEDLSSTLKDLYGPLLDIDIVGKKAAKSNRRAMNTTQGYLDSLTQHAIDLLNDRDKVQKDLTDLDTSYGVITAGINVKFDGLDEAAANSLNAIEERYKSIIPSLEAALAAANAAYDRENSVLEKLVSERNSFLQNIGDGFRKFVNDVKVDEGSSFTKSLQDRVKSVREFTTNIKSLLARGLDPSLVQDFIAAGVDSSGLVVANLAQGSGVDISAINAAQAELAALTSDFQTTASQQYFDIGIAQQEAIVAPLRTAAQQAQNALNISQAARDTELAAAQAHQAKLSLDRKNELAKADKDYKTARDSLLADQERINGLLDLNAVKINKVFLDLSDPETGVPKHMDKLGKQIINGLIDGLEEKFPKLRLKAEAMAAIIRDTLKDAYRINSPSRVMATMGEQIAMGLVIGMEQGIKAIEGAAFDMSAAATPELPGVGYPMMGSSALMGGSAATGNSGSSGFSSTYNITVQAGVGDPRKIGQEVVEYIKTFENSNGKVFVSA